MAAGALALLAAIGCDSQTTSPSSLAPLESPQDVAESVRFDNAFEQAHSTAAAQGKPILVFLTASW